MRNVFVKPAVARNIIRDPSTRIALAADGEWKPANSFWLRRIAQGDVVDLTKQQTQAQAKEAAPAPPAPAKSGPKSATTQANAS